ncbi:MAG: MalY/PatB family protein [Candidatus Limivicinus sp.]|jgi:cystathionine beta-lyase
MKYDFTTILERKGKDSLAADVIPFENVKPEEGFSVIPMWIADMSFPAAPAILRSIRKRMEMPNFGYFALSDEYFDSIINWQSRRNGVEGLTKECIGYENGVLGGVSAAVQAFSAPGDKILVHAPTYVGFTHTLESIGRPIVHSMLKRDSGGIWRMDYEDMDRKLKENNIHLAIFCSPHNPCGRVWERWEIEKAMEVYAANDCVVISDEIWSDIIMPGFKHIPTQTVSEDAKNRVIAFYAPSKTFSLAGLVGSYHIIYNKYLRERVIRQSEMSHYNDCNILSMHALIGAFSPEGEEWADEMLHVIDGNIGYAMKFIEDNFEGVSCMRPQGTYMLYLDCSGFCKSHGISITELQHRGIRCGVIWQNGEDFKYPDTIRMNLALPLSRLEEAMERLRKYVFI